MRTKTLLLTAALSVATVATSMADVFSVNIVGYVNKTITPGYSIIQNPLTAATNTIPALFPNVPNGTSIFKYSQGSGFIANNFFFGWTDPTMTLLPGEGIFINNTSGASFTNTFVGEVAIGATSNAIPQGFSLRGSKVPQSAQLDTVLGFPVVNGDSVFGFDAATQQYVAYNYFFGWNTPPVPAVGEAYFVNKVAATSWDRTFTP
jgi:hypothetical protein